MKLTLKELDAAYSACLKIKDEKLNIKIAYYLTKLATELEAEIKNYEEFNKNLILKYCEKDENGKPIINNTENGDSVNISNENKELLQKELLELNSTEIEIKEYSFKIEDFNSISISISELVGLMPFIKEEIEE